MVPEVLWQASSAATRGSGDAPASDQDTVESLLRRLIRRIEESERRYAEALDELHARLGHVSYSAAVTEAIGTPEETETLERLRLQLSALARRLEQPPEPMMEIERLSPLDKALAEVCAVSAGLAVAEPDWFASSRPSASAPTPEPEPVFNPPPQEHAPTDAAPSLEHPPVSEEEADFDRRLIEMAKRLERSIGEAMPASAIDSLNARMEEISARFEAALEQTPKLETLRHIERQVADMGQQLGRAEQHIARIGVIEQKLQRLIERFDEAPAQLERAASMAAQETARLVGETALGKPSAAERLDALHRDIVAMNERNNATDDRLVDTLVAMHESLKGLMQQGERDKARAMIAPRTSPRQETVATEPRSADFAQPESGGGAPGVSPPPFGSAKRTALTEEVAGDRSRRGTVFIRDIPFESTEDLVAAARRAAQAAAAKAEERDALRLQQALGADKAKRANDEPGRHKVSFLLVAAALLLMVSAALLLTRLKLKPDFYDPPPAAERSVPAPAAEAPPLPESPFQPEVTPSPEADPAPPAAAAPGATPESEPVAPAPSPAEPHAATPSASPVDIQAAPPVRLGDARGDSEASQNPCHSGQTAAAAFRPGRV
jgi:localization factor PodJL